MRKTHLARFDDSDLTMCGLQQGAVIAYELFNFRLESSKFQCARCVMLLKANHPSISLDFEQAAPAATSIRHEQATPAENAPVGRPPELKAGQCKNVYLDALSIERAERLGGGNVSEGIRLALKRVAELDKTTG